MKKDKQIAKLKIKNQDYSVRATIHSLIRMEQYKIDEYVVAGTILSLGHDRLLAYKKSDRDIAVIDKVKKIAVIATFRRNTIKVITIIDKDDIWVKDGTTIEKIF